MPDGDFFMNAWRTVHRLLEPNGVDGSIRICVVRLDDLQHARTEPFPRFRRPRGPTELRNAEGIPHVFLDRCGKAQEVALGGPDPMQRLLVRRQDTSHHSIIPVLGWSSKPASVYLARVMPGISGSVIGAIWLDLDLGV